MQLIKLDTKKMLTRSSKSNLKSTPSRLSSKTLTPQSKKTFYLGTKLSTLVQTPTLPPLTTNHKMALLPPHPLDKPLLLLNLHLLHLLPLLELLFLRTRDHRRPNPRRDRLRRRPRDPQLAVIAVITVVVTVVAVGQCSPETRRPTKKS